MLFNSIDFLIFFPIVIIIYYLIPNKLKRIWLLLTSYFFYMCWNPKYILLLLFSTFVTYACGIMISNSKEKKKIFVVLCIIINLLILAFFKYYGFIYENIKEFLNDYLNVTINGPKFDIVLPIGISFYIFQALGYTIDVYRGNVQSEKNFIDYALFVSFFPQLVAGPIERSKNLLTEIKKEKKFNFENARHGFLIMLWGFFLKLVIADRIAILVDNVYGNAETYSGYYLIVATILFAFQIYCDFYGYSTIAIGSAKVLDIHLCENFNSPYLATSVKDFWRRWHISLSSWFKDYLYIPLGGSKKGKLRTYLNTIIVFAISGLWHGANWTFVIWGLINGVFQVLGDLKNAIETKVKSFLKLKHEVALPNFLKVILTFTLIDISWIFFRAKNLKEAVLVLKSCLTANNLQIFSDKSIFTCGLDEKDFIVLLVSLFVLFIADLLKNKKVEISKKLESKNVFIRFLIYLTMIMAILIFGIWGTAYEAKNFIYFQF